MLSPMQPFNLELFTPTQQDLKGVAAIEVLDIFDGFSKNFHPKGLFSPIIFGKAGSEYRSRVFAYIDMRVEVFHPVIYKAVCDLGSLYEQIMLGKTYAVFDPVLKDFVASDSVAGQTGFYFFVTHFDQIVFEKRAATKREFNIALIEKYKKDCLMSKLLVMPAGLREYTIDANGKPSEDEINNLYRKILAQANMLANIDTSKFAEHVNANRASLQLGVVEIYDYITNAMEGKSRLILGRWASRRTFDSTRNVITSHVPDVVSLLDRKTVSCNQTVVGLLQYMRMTMPLAQHHLLTGYLSDVFPGGNSDAYLVNKKTLKFEQVKVKGATLDSWLTKDGLEKTMMRFSVEATRHGFIEVEDSYLGLLWCDGISYKLFKPTDTLPEGKDAKHLRPLTWAQLYYLHLYKDSDKIPAFNTRYPITGYGSIYPSYLYLKTTIKGKMLEELGDDWAPTGASCVEFPSDADKFYDSMSPASQHLARLGADYDGDILSLTALLTAESQAEIKKLLASRSYFVGVNGQMNFSAADDVISLVLSSITG